MTSKQIVNLLNEALEADEDAIYDLIEFRVECNEAIEEHPTIVPGENEHGVRALGLLGILNGIVGLDGDLIEAVYDEASGDPWKLLYFRLREK